MNGVYMWAKVRSHMSTSFCVNIFSQRQVIMDCPVFNCVHKAFPLSPLRRIWTTSVIHSTWCYIWAHAFTLSRDKLIMSSAKEVDHCLRFATVVVHWLRVVTYNSMNCIATPLVNRTHLPSLYLHGQSQWANRSAITNKGAVGQTLLVGIQLLLIQFCQLLQMAIGCYTLWSLEY